ncbi:MAG: hypothetical protein F4X94_04320 [Dehalococcoidia bacterium]|nr:hypothetical protein [Dehalococcoidia bacterium]
MNEIQLYDKESREEETLCGTDACDIDKVTVQYYVESRMDDLFIGIVCEACKVLAVRWAVRHCEDLEADARVCLTEAKRLREGDAARYRNSVEEAEMETERLLDRASQHRQIANRLAKETASNHRGDQETGPLIHLWGVLAFSTCGRDHWARNGLQAIVPGLVL